MIYRLRRITSIVLCAAVMFLLGTAAFAAQSAPDGAAAGYWLGDADGDGKVTVLDATTIQKKLASISVHYYNEAAANVDGDAKVTVLDATNIQKYLAHISVPYPIGEWFDDPTEPPTDPVTEPATESPTDQPIETQRPTDEEGWGTDIFRP